MEAGGSHPDGSCWTNWMNAWSEKIDAALEQKDKQIADILERLRKLEGGAK
jgi:hypothetical protein